MSTPFFNLPFCVGKGWGEISRNAAKPVDFLLILHKKYDAPL
jgi:hypothetical protein